MKTIWLVIYEKTLPCEQWYEELSRNMKDSWALKGPAQMPPMTLISKKVV